MSPTSLSPEVIGINGLLVVQIGHFYVVYSIFTVFWLLFLVIFETSKNLLLSLVGLSSAEPFWKYDRPERFVKWATEAIPQIIAEGVRDGLV